MTKQHVFVAVTNDISTDNRVDKVCSFLLQNNFSVAVYGRVLSNTIEVDKKYSILRKKHIFNHTFLFYAEYNIRLFFYLIFHKYDVILANDLDTLPACYFASKIKGIKLVYDSHELFSEGPELQGRNSVQGFWRKLENYFLPKIKNSYTVSQSIADFYDEKYHNKMGVVRNLPELNRKIIQKKVNFPTENKVILYQGVLNPGRGIKPTIEALHFLTDIDFVIIGYGKVEQELKDFVKQQKLEKRVHFLGRIPNEELPNYTRMADVGIVLEEPLGKSFEFSLPNKLFDYIHAELPIVSGTLPEIKKVIETHKVGVIVESYTPKSIANMIEELVSSADLIAEIKESQRQAKQVLNWENEVQQLRKYFN
jgi:glycosyltransferase involved in cell wall biosynthesis